MAITLGNFHLTFQTLNLPSQFLFQFARFFWLTIFGQKSHVQYHIHGVRVYTTFRVSMFIAWVWGRRETGHNRPPKITLRVAMFIAWVWGRGETGHNRLPKITLRVAQGRDWPQWATQNHFESGYVYSLGLGQGRDWPQ